jgi:hypothetical protein
VSQNWEEFLKLRNKVNFKGLETVPVTLRIPKELKKIIIEDLRALEDIDDKTPMNTYILLMMMLGSGTTQRTEGDFYRSKNISLDKFLKEEGSVPKRRRKKKGE